MCHLAGDDLIVDSFTFQNVLNITNGVRKGRAWSSLSEQRMTANQSGITHMSGNVLTPPTDSTVAHPRSYLQRIREEHFTARQQ
jgi:hypothetical protein